MKRALVLALVSACFLFGSDAGRLAVPASAPIDVRLGCALAQSRCTHCHSADRIVELHVESPEHWRQYVHRMRLQPQSGIAPDEEDPIARCLVYRSFGSGAR